MWEKRLAALGLKGCLAQASFFCMECRTHVLALLTTSLSESSLAPQRQEICQVSVMIFSSVVDFQNLPINGRICTLAASLPNAWACSHARKHT